MRVRYHNLTKRAPVEKSKDVIKNESKRNYKDFSEVPLKSATNYAAFDSFATLQLFNKFFFSKFNNYKHYINN